MGVARRTCFRRDFEKKVKQECDKIAPEARRKIRDGRPHT